MGAHVHYLRYGRAHLPRFAKEFRRVMREGRYHAIHDHADYASGWHFLMGVVLGSVFALSLLFLNAQHLQEAIFHSSAPITTLIVFVFGVSAYFGFGAAITGFQFIVADET